MSDLAVLVPVLRRPHRIRPLRESVHASLREKLSPTLVLFVPSPDDTPTIEQLNRAGCTYTIVDGNYAAKINTAIRQTSAAASLLFLGADDLEFQPGWFEAAKAKIDEGAQVVGVNDLIERDRDHATHFLVTRAYAELPMLDGSVGPAPTPYHHWWVDDELIATAKKRGVYAYAADSHVKHLHPMAGLVADDEVYALGRSHWKQDRQIFRRREVLWT